MSDETRQGGYPVCCAFVLASALVGNYPSQAQLNQLERDTAFVQAWTQYQPLGFGLH
jgi:hypothetical protein